MTTPVVTVVITTRDRQHLLARAVASAVSQTLRDIEIIIVDDGSVEPVEKPIDDERVLVVRRERAGGPCLARNVGLQRATGGWITFLDDDDELLPDMIQTCLDAAQASTLPPPVAALAAIEVVDHLGQTLRVCASPSLPLGRDQLLDEKQRDRDFNTYNLLAPTDVVRQIAGFDQGLPSFEHDDYVLRLNRICSIQGMTSPVYRAWGHAGPRLHYDFMRSVRGLERTLEKHQALYATHPRAHATALLNIGTNYLYAGHRLSAIRAAAHSIAVDRRQLGGVKLLMLAIGGRRAWTFYRRVRGRGALPVPASFDRT